MSALRNTVPRRPHKERSQEHSRARYGLLEKHKDYSKRAKDFNEKKARLRILRQKATDRNPDEFHFAMLSGRTKNGVKITDRGNTALSDVVVKLLKTQDAGYLRTMLSKVRKERKRLEEEVMVKGDGSELKTFKSGTKGGMSNHRVFVDDEETQQEFTTEEFFQTDDSGVERTYNRPRKPTDVTGGAASSVKQSPREREAALAAWKARRALEKKQARFQDTQAQQYKAVKNREKELTLAEQELDLQRAKMNNTLGGVNKNGIKFKVRERKR